MGTPKLKDIRRLFAVSGNKCAMPGCNNPIYDESGFADGNLCHIKAAKKGGPRYDITQSEKERHAFDNLILLCRKHHTLIDNEIDKYSVETLTEIKKLHETYAGPANIEDSNEVARVLMETLNMNNNSGNIAVNSPGVIQGKNISVYNAKKSVPILPAQGSIGADVIQSGYIQYLINRYNKFASQQPKKGRKFSHGAIAKNLSDKFGTNWRLLPVEKFEDLVQELHRRIDRTKIARINKGKNQKSYSTFDEYIKKHGYG